MDFNEFDKLVIQDNLKKVESALKDGYDVNKMGKYKTTHIISAVNPIHPDVSYEMIQLLLKYSADPHKKNQLGIDAFQFTSDKQIIKMLKFHKLGKFADLLR